MKLTKNIEVNIYEVLADYKVKNDSSPFIAILKFAQENGDKINPNMLYEKLLKPLSKKACENLLDRLTNMGYFKKYDYNNDDDYYDYNDDDYYNDDYYNDDEYYTANKNQSNINYYTLTGLGKDSAQKETFYEDRRGILKIYVTDSKFVSQKIIKVVELEKDSFREENSIINNINRELKLKNLQNNQNIISLKNGSFILDKFDSKCRILEREEKLLIINTNINNFKITVLDYENYVEESEEQIKSEILYNKFGKNYNKKDDVIFVKFNKDDLSFLRNIKIKEPNFQNNIFNPLTIEDVIVSPKDFSDAKKWHKSLVIEQIDRYFLSDSEFTSFVNKVSDRFVLYKKELKDSINRQDLIKQLSGEQHFYKRAKLETIDYLNY